MDITLVHIERVGDRATGSLPGRPIRVSIPFLRTGPRGNPSTHKWTILHYSAGDNNLRSYLVDDVDEMERVGSDDLTNLVVQLDVGNPEGARRYYLEQNSSPGVGSPVLQEMGSVNIASARPRMWRW